MAPELLEGNPIDAPAEIYSLGVLAFEILSGRRPFESMPSLVAAHRNGAQAPPLYTLCPNVPGWVSAAVDRAPCRDRAARFATAVEFANAAWPDRDSKNVGPY
jgi:serine/threonine-protein kinase